MTRVVLFNANYGQHMAIIAGFERCRGERIVTLDADLQNPPEEIGKLLAAMDAGHDYVGGVRRTREDSWWRRLASRAMNRLRERITRIRMTDQGCMLRAYSRDIVDAIAGEPRGQHLHSRRSPTRSRATRPRSRSRTRSAPRASRSIRSTS